MTKLFLMAALLLSGTSAYAGFLDYSYAVTFGHLDYTVTSVTTASYVPITNVLPQAVTHVQIYDSSNKELKFGHGPDCSHISGKFIVTPGGNGDKNISIPKGDCVALESLVTTVATGVVDINFFN